MSSFHRDGNPDGNIDEFRTCLLRTLKTATHKTGHMFTMYHCTKYECGMRRQQPPRSGRQAAGLLRGVRRQGVVGLSK